MAKSKNGGTRAYIRGRVGADVYSIGRTANGKKQQVVRSLAESVANPQTVAQMRGRMIMSTVMQALAVLRPIVDHSFDNVSGIQPNLSEFIRRNYALIKEDIAAHPTANNVFGLVAYGEKGAKQGQYIISDGKAAVPAAVTIAKASGVLTIALGDNDLTIAGLKAALGLGNEGYMTMVGLSTSGLALYVRMHVSNTMASTTALTADNLAEVFELDGTVAPVMAISGKNITVTIADIANCCSCIITRKTAAGFIHSKATLGAGNGFNWPSATALPTYPVGEQKFLNGGGDETAVVNPDSGETAPTGTERTLTITKDADSSAAEVSVDGSAIQSGASVMSGKLVTVKCTAAETKAVRAKIGNTSVNMNGSVGGQYTGTFYMPDANSTLAISQYVPSEGGGQDGDGN